ncbi:kinase-like domain-containing protein [Fomes fomentarius]|nr:kinase-like domain-containing protein [Fomes fomentarius]
MSYPRRTTTTTTDSGFASSTHTKGSPTRGRETVLPVASSSRQALDASQLNDSQTQAGEAIHISPTVAEECRGPVKNLKDLQCIRALGTGGWSDVYLVQVKKLRGRPVGKSGALMALKRIEKRSYRDSERNDPREDRWHAAEWKHIERRALSNLPWNPFIAGLFDAYSDSRNLYFLLELGAQGTIHERILTEGPLSIHTAKFYFVNLVLAIEFLHTYGIVHKDVKNENILIGADGYCMLTDFGLSALAHEGKEWDSTGTFYFWSPEMLADEADTSQARFAMDWWCAACCLFEMTTGEVPFKVSDTDPEQPRTPLLREAHEQGNIRWPDKPVDNQLEDLITRMFHPNLLARYAAISAYSDDGLAINIELREHGWLTDLSWYDIERRIALAPALPLVDLHMTGKWKPPNLPDWKRAPGMRLPKRQRPRFDRYGKFIAEDRPIKRRRTETVSSMRVEAGST